MCHSHVRINEKRPFSRGIIWRSPLVMNHLEKIAFQTGTLRRKNVDSMFCLTAKKYGSFAQDYTGITYILLWHVDFVPNPTLYRPSTYFVTPVSELIYGSALSPASLLAHSRQIYDPAFWLIVNIQTFEIGL